MFVWQAHAGAVTSLAFGAGGLLSTGSDGLVKYWNPLTGEEQFRWPLDQPESHNTQSRLLRVLTEASGQYGVIGHLDHGVIFLDLERGLAEGLFQLRSLHQVAISPQGDSVFVAGSRSATATHLWEIEIPSGSVIGCSPEFGRFRHNRLVISPDASLIIVGDRRLDWRTRTFDALPMLCRGSMFAVSPDGDKLFGVNGSRLLVWGLQVGAYRRAMKGHVAPITGLTSTPDGRKLWTASADATVRQWDVETYRCEKCYGFKIGPLGCVAVSNDGLTAAAGSSLHGTIAMWDLE